MHGIPLHIGTAARALVIIGVLVQVHASHHSRARFRGKPAGLQAEARGAMGEGAGISP